VKDLTYYADVQCDKCKHKMVKICALSNTRDSTSNRMYFHFPEKVFSGIFKCPHCGNKVIVTIVKKDG